jgi:DNA-binding response OmpR family regulator
MAMLLIIEDEAVLARNVARFFEKLGHTVEVALDGPAGVEAARRVLPDVAIVDFQLPGLDGLEVIGALRKIDAELRCVMVTGHASVPVAIDAMKAGYMDLLTKPVALASLKAVVDRALAERGTRRALDYYQKKEADESSLGALAGDSAPMQALRDLVRTIALSEPADRSPGAPILVLGETGAGKELVARACHYAGPRASAPFVEINCAALPAHLIEGELFGHEKGAFTDAQARKIGLIEAADGGTLFLDEIGELDLSLQAKLLRVLENFRVRRLGALQDPAGQRARGLRHQPRPGPAGGGRALSCRSAVPPAGVPDQHPPVARARRRRAAAGAALPGPDGAALWQGTADARCVGLRRLARTHLARQRARAAQRGGAGRAAEPGPAAGRGRSGAGPAPGSSARGGRRPGAGRRRLAGGR